LVGRAPKDFDIATDAHPQQIRRLFRSARIIGRRFRIVHVYCSPQKYFEVTTFRARGSASDESDFPAGPENNNLFGTIEEDAERRDFTINALYYCPIDRQLLDYVNGLPDVRQKRLRTLVAAGDSFAEDPVRIIRAVKYASLLGFSVPLSMAGLIRRTHASLLTCSRERMTEEMYKILTSGGAGRIFELSVRLGVFDTILPAISGWLRAGRMRFSDSGFGKRIASLDERAAAGQLLDRGEMFSFLFQELLREKKGLLEGEEPYLLVQQHLREVSAPLFPSRKDLMTAADLFLKEHLPRHAAERARGPRGRGHQVAHREGQPRPPGTRRRRRGGRRRGGRGHAPAAPPA
jgi:poly(A) polymerase